MAAIHIIPDARPRRRVAIVDDHELLADSLASALIREGFDAVAVAPRSAPDVLRQVHALEPNVVLLDLHLGKIGSAVPLIEPLRASGLDVLCVTGELSRATWGACIEAGALAVVSKATRFEELVARITAVLVGEAPISVCEREALLHAVHEHRVEERVRLEPFQRLTVRECEVLHELMEGRSAEMIADRGYVSLTTVRSHIRAILQKLGVSSQLAAVTMAVRANWTSPHRRQD